MAREESSNLIFVEEYKGEAAALKKRTNLEQRETPTSDEKLKNGVISSEKNKDKMILSVQHFNSPDVVFPVILYCKDHHSCNVIHPIKLI